LVALGEGGCCTLGFGVVAGMGVGREVVGREGGIAVGIVVGIVVGLGSMAGIVAGIGCSW
jgi:hypothetical protein